ncbi:hypothetical protein GCM10023085_54920 [Actinomadura viridis]|uniref:Uncharacterized protein n=1 Tax=Actinomadura viridis TaxID=58110 RepID=A0A931GKI9_9ACTN|nr:hypothetical protein [Actinomadura viridis]MBG6086451.1 hypothetical protein [Actinomadura viridis]
MSGPNEAGDPAEAPGAHPVPGAPAPPSFGRTDPPAGEPGAPAPAADSGDDPEPAASPQITGELRLPIGLQQPWWAAAPGGDSEAAPEAASEAEAPAGIEAATPPEPTPPPAKPTEPAEPAEPTRPAEAPRPAASGTPGAPAAGHPGAAPEVLPGTPLGTPPGRLVAGRGGPKADTRGALPAEPAGQEPTGYPDTDPDGIPVMRPAEAAEAAADARTGAPPAPGQVPSAGDRSGDEGTGPAGPPPPAPGTPGTGTPAMGTPGTGTPATGTSGTGTSGRAKGTGTGENPLPAPLPDSLLKRDAPPHEDAPGSRTTPIAVAAAAKSAPPGAQPPAEDAKGSGPAALTPVYYIDGLSAGGGPAPGEGGGGTSPFGAGPLGSGPGERGGGGRKRLLIGGGVVAAAVIAVAGFALAGSGSESEGRPAKADRAPGPVTAPPAPPSGAPTPTATPGPPSKIDNVRTDPAPLALSEAFPTTRVDLGGRAYSRDRASVNHRCALAARGAMAQALTRERCGSVVRVTFLDRERSLAVTTGIAVLPGKAAALRANGAGDPSRYEWFRGMAGNRTQGIDRAGGYAAGTVRGRYIAYAYATYANGKRPQPGDPTLKTVAEQFVGYALRPIDARARA